MVDKIESEELLLTRASLEQIVLKTMNDMNFKFKNCVAVGTGCLCCYSLKAWGQIIEYKMKPRILS